MDKTTTIICSVAFAIAGVCVAINDKPVPTLVTTMSVNASNQMLPAISNIPRGIERTNKDTVFVKKTDTVKVIKTKLKYVTKVRVKSKEGTSYLPAFSLKIPSGSWETSHDSTKVKSI